MNWFNKFRKALTEPKPGTEGIMESPFMNFTPRAQQVLALARKEADRFNHNFLGTEHMLLGLLREGNGVAGKVLEYHGVNLEETRREIVRELDPNFSYQPDGETKNLPSKETTSMPSRFEMPQNPEPDKSKQDSIDTSKRYDVYCTERNQE